MYRGLVGIGNHHRDAGACGLTRVNITTGIVTGGASAKVSC